MEWFNKLMKKLNLSSDQDQEYDDYDDYSEFDEEPEKKPAKAPKKSVFHDDIDREEEDVDDFYAAPKKAQPAPVRTTYAQPERKVVGISGAPTLQSEIRTIKPKSFEDANLIAETLLQNKAVILNLENLDTVAAQRIVDFACGACYTLSGSLQKITSKIFAIVPENVDISGDFEQEIGDMINLNSVNMLK